MTAAPVACGGVQQVGPGVGEIKRMWVDPEWRGAGLGSRMLRHLEAEAARLGHRPRRASTPTPPCVEAIAMYERAGYSHIERYNDNPYAQAWFEKVLASHGAGSRAAYCSRVRKASWAGLVDSCTTGPSSIPSRRSSATDFSLRDVRLDHDPPHGRVGEREVEQEPHQVAGEAAGRPCGSAPS